MILWIGMDNFKMQLIEFQSSSTWKQKFVNLRVYLENIEKKRLETRVPEKKVENKILKTCNTIPKIFICLKHCAIAIPLIFSSTYVCESVFLLMNFVKSH